MEARASFGEWLRARRNALDLTQFELAQKAGCAEDTIGRIEAGTRRPSKQIALLLAKALGVPNQSHADFVRFAREGGSGADLDHVQTGGPVAAVGTAGEAAATLLPAGPKAASNATRSTRSHPVAWTPYLSSLPQAPTPLIGRGAEVDAAVRLLSSEHARLLTLVGPPGVGKTRLALALASALTPAFPDGICFVPLAPMRNPELLALTVAHAVGLSDGEGGGGLQPAHLLDHLRTRRLLLVLDNFEHIMPATRQVAEWLSSSVKLQVLVTSRSALQLRGERLFSVSALPIPPDIPIIRGAKGTPLMPPETPDLEVLATCPSVALFVERVQAADPGFRLIRENARAVSQLCRQMEGLPLALELAAARSARLGPELVLARLQRRLDIATSGSREVLGDLPYHQQTLRAAIAWSYDLLGREERLLFARMSVFAGGATLAALEAVCNAHNDLESGVDCALEGLLQQSLVYRVVVERSGEDQFAGSRFNMLEMLREYALETLADQPTVSNAMSRYHAEYYLAIAEAAAPELRLAHYEKWCRILESDLDNIRAALEWSLRAPAGDLVLGVRLAGSMGLYWYGEGHHIEGIRWTQQFYERLDEVPVMYHASFLIGAGILACVSDPGEAERYFTQALDVSRELGDKLHTAWALIYLGYVKLEEPGVAMPTAKEGLELFRELNHLPGVAQGLNIIGEIARSSGDDAYAKHAYEECMVICEETGETGRISMVCGNLCMIARHEGDYERALEFAHQALDLACGRKNMFDIAYGLSSIAGCIHGVHPAGSLAHRAELQRAARLLGASEAALERMGAFLQPADRPELARIEAEVRKQLDKATFQASWDEGREMTLDQAIADALDGRR